MIGWPARRFSVLLSALSALCLSIALLPAPRPTLAADDERTYDALSFAILGWLALGVALLLYRAAGPRALLFVLTPVLLLDGFINWDLLAVLLATGSIVAFIRRRDGWAAALAGLGAAAKVYPFLLLPLYAADRAREAGRRAGLRVLGIGLATWVAVNLPVALASFHGWWVFYAFSGDRQPLGASTWGVLCRRVLSCDSIPPIDAASLVAFVGLSAWAWWVKVRRDPEVPRWTLIFPIVVAFLLTNKIYSPQYSLWLLPLFALVLPDVRLVVAFVSADLAVFVAELSTNFPDLLPAPLPFWVLDVAAFVRAFVLIVCVARYLRTPWIEIAGAPDSRGVEGTLVDAT